MQWNRVLAAFLAVAVLVGLMSTTSAFAVGGSLPKGDFVSLYREHCPKGPLALINALDARYDGSGGFIGGQTPGTVPAASVVWTNTPPVDGLQPVCTAGTWGTYHTRKELNVSTTGRWAKLDEPLFDSDLPGLGLPDGVTVVTITQGPADRLFGSCSVMFIGTTDQIERTWHAGWYEPLNRLKMSDADEAEFNEWHKARHAQCIINEIPVGTDVVVHANTREDIRPEQGKPYLLVWGPGEFRVGLQAFIVN